MSIVQRIGTRLPRRGVRALLACVLTLAPVAVTHADDYVDRVNAPLKAIAKAKRSDLVILPLLAKMAEPPAEIRSVEVSMLLGKSSPAWSVVEAWAAAAPQQAIIEGLNEVTRDEDFRTAMVFAQPYGVEGVSDQPELLSANMFSDLGETPTLAAVKIGYLKSIEKLELLANIESTRLIESGDPIKAIDVMFDFLYFARQMADRPFLVEKQWGMTAMSRSLARIRDLTYLDSKADKHGLKAEDIRAWVKRLDPEKGYLDVHRIRLPEANLIAAEQLITRVTVKGGGTNDEFSIVMAAIAAGDRPLRLLSESAFWERVRTSHGGYFDLMDMVIGKKGDGGVRSDWARRWDLKPFDSLLRKPSDYARNTSKGSKFALLKVSLDGVDQLFDLRKTLMVELVGTHVGISIYGYALQSRGAWPRDVTSIRPYFMDKIDTDPYSSRKNSTLEFFVPTRDRPPQGTRGEEIPFDMRVYPGGKRSNFSIKLYKDTFVLYSVGPNEANDLGNDATQDDTSVNEGDYVLWPPVISLTRKYLADAGQQP
ncbi:MAG: hypothetical protein H7210_06895 [Pyrinomonadaceae bacterium]|nr:hypothetical protein [Phycisphaerales bacterium]